MKGPADFVSTADKRTERILVEELSRARPGYGILGEEGGAIDGPDKSHRFIIDPIDGTTNFLHGMPHFAISIALEREGQLVAGVVFNPVTDDMYHRRERPWRLSQQQAPARRRAAKRWRAALFATGMPFMGRRAMPAPWPMKAVMAITAGIRRCGAASLDLACVAAGRFDGFWERGLKAWDVAAASCWCAKQAAWSPTWLAAADDGRRQVSAPTNICIPSS